MFLPMVDNVTASILIILSFLLIWIGIMVFTTKPEEEEELKEEGKEITKNEEIEKYKRIIAELEEKIKRLEEKPSNDRLLDWLNDLRRENDYLKMKLAHLEGGRMNFEEEALKYENEKLKRQLQDYKNRIEKLENEIKELKNSLVYYRDMVSKLQGNYTVLNKYNYRICIRNPDTGEYEYQLIKLPPDFDPFNPTYITRDGIEVFEEYGIKIPTKLGDIIRNEFRKELYWKDFEIKR